MNLMRLDDNRFLNMNLLVDAERVVDGTIIDMVILRFCAPWEQATYRHEDFRGDGSAVVPYEVVLQGERAAFAWQWLHTRAIAAGMGGRP